MSDSSVEPKIFTQSELARLMSERRRGLQATIHTQAAQIEAQQAEIVRLSAGGAVESHPLISLLLKTLFAEIEKGKTNDA